MSPKRNSGYDIIHHFDDVIEVHDRIMKRSDLPSFILTTVKNVQTCRQA